MSTSRISALIESIAQKDVGCWHADLTSTDSPVNLALDSQSYKAEASRCERHVCDVFGLWLYKLEARTKPPAEARVPDGIDDPNPLREYEAFSLHGKPIGLGRAPPRLGALLARPSLAAIDKPTTQATKSPTVAQTAPARGRWRYGTSPSATLRVKAVLMKTSAYTSSFIVFSIAAVTFTYSKQSIYKTLFFHLIYFKYDFFVMPEKHFPWGPLLLRCSVGNSVGHLSRTESGVATYDGSSSEKWDLCICALSYKSLVALQHAI